MREGIVLSFLDSGQDFDSLAGAWPWPMGFCVESEKGV